MKKNWNSILNDIKKENLQLEKKVEDEKAPRKFLLTI